MFEKTKNIVNEYEQSSLLLRTNSTFVNSVLKVFVYPFLYVMAGIEYKIKSFYQFWGYVFLFFMIVLVSAALFSFEESIAGAAFAIVFYLALFLSLFVVPSTYAFYDIENKDVNKAALIIENNGIKTFEKLELLEQNLAIVGLKIKTKISFFKIIVATFWASIIFIINVNLKLFKPNTDSSFELFINSNLQMMVLSLAITFLAIMLIAGYQHTAEKFIRTLEFASINLKQKYSKKSGISLLSERVDKRK